MMLLLGGDGGELKGVKFGAEGVTEGGIDHAVLGDAGLAFEAGVFDRGGEVVAVGVIDLHLGAGEGGLDALGEVVGEFGHRR